MSDSPLETILQRIGSLSEDHDEISFGEAVDAVGGGTFAPILLLIGVIMAVPGPADIPGVPVLLGVLVIVVCVQILLGREHIWVPRWIENRRVTSRRLQQMVRWLQTPAAWLDRAVKKRYAWMIDHAGASVIATVCIVISMATPVMEFVPLSANVAGLAIATLALALLAKDGLVGALALVFCFATVAVIVYHVMT